MIIIKIIYIDTVQRLIDLALINGSLKQLTTHDADVIIPDEAAWKKFSNETLAPLAKKMLEKKLAAGFLLNARKCAATTQPLADMRQMVNAFYHRTL